LLVGRSSSVKVETGSRCIRCAITTGSTSHFCRLMHPKELKHNGRTKVCDSTDKKAISSRKQGEFGHTNSSSIEDGISWCRRTFTSCGATTPPGSVFHRRWLLNTKVHSTEQVDPADCGTSVGATAFDEKAQDGMAVNGSTSTAKAFMFLGGTLCLTKSERSHPRCEMRWGACGRLWQTQPRPVV